jgi:hypothetical protein
MAVVRHPLAQTPDEKLGAASAAFGAGLSRSVLGSYLPAFFTSGAICIVAAALVITIQKSQKLKPKAA